MSRFPHSLEQVRRIHILGVCGTLMGAFAVLLKKRGIEVSGSDQNVYPPMSDVLHQAGVRLFQGYHASNLETLGNEGTVDLVVVGNVISQGNDEMEEVLRRGLPYASLPEVMEKLLLQETQNLVVCGTHGKTTTSTLLAHVLREIGADPSYFFGGVAPGFDESFHLSRQFPKGSFVLEGDEYDTAYWDKVPKFSHYRPSYAIFTSLEFDHADIYADLSAVEDAFRLLVNGVDSNGACIACFDYPSIPKLLSERSDLEVISYGSSEDSGARYILGDRLIEGERSTFSILEKGEEVARLETSLAGQYNFMNILGVWILCRHFLCDSLGVGLEQVASAIASYHGVKRRLETRGEPKGRLVIDDFAHHPTAVKGTLGALRERYPDRRLLAVFEPRSATSRRSVFQKQYAESFSSAHRVFIAEPFHQAKIPEDQRFSSQSLVNDLSSKGIEAQTFSSVEAGVSRIAQDSAEGDVIVVLSNGGFGGLIPKLMEAICLLSTASP